MSCRLTLRRGHWTGRPLPSYPTPSGAGATLSLWAASELLPAPSPAAKLPAAKSSPTRCCCHDHEGLQGALRPSLRAWGGASVAQSDRSSGRSTCAAVASPTLGGPNAADQRMLVRQRRLPPGLPPADAQGREHGRPQEQRGSTGGSWSNPRKAVTLQLLHLDIK